MKETKFHTKKVETPVQENARLASPAMNNNHSDKQTRRELQLVLKCCLETKRLYLIELKRRHCLNFIQFAFGDVTTTNVQLYTAPSSSESFSFSKVSLQMHIVCWSHLDDNRIYSVSTRSSKNKSS